MLTKRDVYIGCLAALATLTGVAAQQPSMLPSTAWEWTAMTVRETKVGTVRQVVRAPTVTLDELEIHITTLNPGETSHPPHQHPNEELLIIKEGTVEALVAGDWKRLGVGGVIFQASNQPHAIRNAGSGPATYHVVNWKSAATPPK